MRSESPSAVVDAAAIEDEAPSAASAAAARLDESTLSSASDTPPATVARSSARFFASSAFLASSSSALPIDSTNMRATPSARPAPIPERAVLRPLAALVAVPMPVADAFACAPMVFAEVPAAFSDAVSPSAARRASAMADLSAITCSRPACTADDAFGNNAAMATVDRTTFFVVSSRPLNASTAGCTADSTVVSVSSTTPASGSTTDIACRLKLSNVCSELSSIAWAASSAAPAVSL